MDIEDKLNLIQQLHREQEENERNIYHNLRYRNYDRKWNDFSVCDDGYYKRDDSQNQEVQGSWIASFRLRLLLAVLLFLCFFVMEKKNIKYGEIGYQEVVEYIGSNSSKD